MTTKKKLEIPAPSLSTLTSPPWADDQNAKAEEKNWDNEDKLKGQKVANELLWLKAYGWVVIAFLTVFSVLFIGSLATWSLHYLLPTDLHWLTTVQLEKIQSILFSGGIGGVISVIAQKQISK